MPYVKQKKRNFNSTAVISLSFLAVITVGTILLMMPFSSAEGNFTNPVTAFFTAVSATCVTGLVDVDTGTYWTTFGQLVILAMIQVGGLGLITFASFFAFMLNKKVELRSMQVASESVNTSGFYDVKYLVKSIVSISFACELAGALLLMTSYVPKFGAKGIYISCYLAVTAFCNAGFDVLGMVDVPFSSVTSLSDDPITVIVIPLLIISGGLGFFVWNDVINYKKNKHLALQTKIVLLYTAVLIATGTLFTLILEWNNPSTLGGHSFLYKLGNSFFNSVTLRTAGFNSIDIASMTPLTKLISIFYMFVGVAPGSTGGGIKITTFAIVIMTVFSVITNKQDTIIMNRKIDKELVYKSLAIIFIFIVIIMVSSVAITFMNENVAGLDAAFEITSAISTTGLSTGVTAQCETFSKLLLCLIMFIGRVGPVSFALSLSLKNAKQSKNEVYPEGRIMVG